MVIVAILFTIVLIIVTFVVGYVVFLALWMAAVFLTRRKRKVLWGFVSLPVYAVGYIALVVGLFLHLNSPTQVYTNTFGFPPSAQVTDLETDLYSFADNSEAYLYFKADRATVDQIVWRGMTPVTPTPNPAAPNPSSAAAQPGGANPPDWYRPSHSAGLEVYEGHNIVQRHMMEEEVLIYDPATGEVWFHYSGID